MVMPTANFPDSLADANERAVDHDLTPAEDPLSEQIPGFYLNQIVAEIIALETFLLSGVAGFRAINKTGGTLVAGRFVGVNGRDATTGLPTIGYAAAASGVNALTARGILPAEVLDAAECWVRTLGIYGPLDVSTGAAEGVIWLDSAAGGLFLLAPPQWPVRAQRLGRVAVVGTGPTDGYIWVEPEELNDIRSVTQRIGGLAGSDDRFLFAAPFACHLVQAVLVSDTPTAGSNAGNNWSFQLRNLTAAVNLLSAAKTTNGNEMGADAPYPLDPNQNLKISQFGGDVIELQIVKTGAPTDLTGAEIMVQVEFVPDTDD